MPYGTFFQSTGDSLDDEDNEEEKCLTEAKKNTAYNEVIDADNPQTPSEVSSHLLEYDLICLSVLFLKSWCTGL